MLQVTPESVAKHTADRLRGGLIVDGTCGVGGNAIQFALTSQKVKTAVRWRVQQALARGRLWLMKMPVQSIRICRNEGIILEICLISGLKTEQLAGCKRRFESRMKKTKKAMMLVVLMMAVVVKHRQINRQSKIAEDE